MNSLKIYSEKHISGYLSVRSGESKLGEKIDFISDLEALRKNPAEFVIFGIPEDIGVRANYGKQGTSNAWEAFLGSFLNVQHNRFFNSEKVLLLGEINTSEEMKKAANIDISDPNYHQKLGDLTELIDEKVSSVVKEIISAGKIPVIIGGGHNNAYGNLKGASEAYQNPVNALNIDAHTDLRSTEYRHSGNGFSYALKNGFLKKYSVYGLHENYTPEYIFREMNGSEDLQYQLFETLPKQDKISPFGRSIDFVNEDNFGLELDCDAISNFPSSAVSPTGLTLNDARELVKLAGKEKKCCYLHVCEAIAKDDFPTGKAISFLVTDFLKTRMHE